MGETIRSWRRYLRFWRPDVAADVDDELRFHLETRIEELIAAGLSPDEARDTATAEFGDVARVRAGLQAIGQRRLDRSERGARWSALAHEVRFALRRLVRQPAFAVPSILTLALGIGAAAAAFTLLDAVVLEPLPYPGASRLVRLYSAVPGINAAEPWGLAKGQFLYYQHNAHTLAAMGLYELDAATLAPRASSGDIAEQIHVASVSASLGGVIGAGMELGRSFSSGDNISRDPSTVILTHDLWVRRFGGSAAVLGTTIVLDGAPLQVIGVLAADVRLPEELAGGALPAVDAWLPLWLDPAQPAQNHHTYHGIARLRDGASLTAAKAELAGLTARFPEVMPTAYGLAFWKRSRFAIEVTTLRDDVLGGIARVLWIIFGSVTLVLGIAVANVGNLFLVRHAARRRETAVRAALGADRGRIAQHFLAESVPLALISGVLGLALAWVAVRTVIVLAPGGIPRLDEVRLGAAPITLALVVSLGIGLLFGLLPIVRRGDHELPMLGESGRGLTPSRRQHAARNALIVGQVALSLVLLSGAALMLQSFRHLRNVRSGIDAHGVLTFDILLTDPRYQSFDAVDALHRDLSDRIQALPSVEVVGMTTSLPLDGAEGCSGIIPENATAESTEWPSCVPVIVVEPGYFRALRIDVRGRAPDRSDVERRAGVAVMSEALARRIWPGTSAIGRGIRSADKGEFSRVIGVTGDVRANGLDKPPVQAVYITQFPASNLIQAIGGPARGIEVVVRTRSDHPEQLMPAIRRIVAELDAQVPVTRVRTMDDIVAASTARVSFTTLLLVIASVIALVLSAVGMYGVIGYIVAQRRAEIGLRMALGARGGQVGALVVWQSVRLALVGVAIGATGAAVTSRLLRSLLFEMSPSDPATFGAVCALLLALAAAASYVPARRAMRVDPVEALRPE